MDFGSPVRDLGKVDVRAIQAAVNALDPAEWDRCDFRQKAFDVHKQTKSIVLMLPGGWPEVVVTRHPGWDLLSPIIVPFMLEFIKGRYPVGGTFISSMVANLRVGAQIDRHYDAAPYFEFAHRIHVPLKTNDGVEFIVGDQHLKLKVGRAYEINNLMDHEVANKGSEDRYHLIFDYVPPQQGSTGDARHPDASHAAPGKRVN